MTAAPKKNEKIDIDRAKLSPASEFAHPEDVVDAAIGENDKKKILSQWKTDADALSRAGNEGMAGGESPRSEEIEKAREKVDPGALDKESDDEK